ncbi:MAG: hypothetical protein K6T71_02565 [Candidatus Bipolaricaulota bacterium]|nr:hypothetical protein [Candidatus Bipolaricaulota bacterium]
MSVARILRWAGIGVLWVGIVAIVAFAQVIRVLPEVNFGQVAVGTTKTLEYVFTNPHNEQATINTVGFGDRFYGQDPPFEVAGLVLPTTLPPAASSGLRSGSPLRRRKCTGQGTRSLCA